MSAIYYLNEGTIMYIRGHMAFTGMLESGLVNLLAAKSDASIKTILN
jgi:hypothetical protein